MKKNLKKFLAANPLFQRLALSEEERSALSRAIEEDYFVEFLSGLISEAEEIMAIDPRLEQRKILEIAAERIVRDLGAEAASIRLFDPESLKMTSFGAYGLTERERAIAVPFLESIAGKVVRENRCIAVPSILQDPHYKTKDIVERRGFHSLLGVPIRIPRFFGPSRDVLGSLQIYYKEENRRFNRLETLHAELLARRVSYVLAKKKILDLRDLNTRKEKIANKIFVKLSRREVIKLKDLFILLIPELRESLQVRSCALFTVSDDSRFIHVEAAYPEEQVYHEPGYTFTVSHHPYFALAVTGAEKYGDREYEHIDPSYILIRDPLKSALTSAGMKKFAKEHHINSILLVPLRVDNRVRHLLTFHATAQKREFSEEEIELLTFFGKEIMKASKLEFLGDVLHDLKNPAVAIAGFARRARKLLESEDLAEVREKLMAYLDIVVRETIRLQDLALAMTAEGREEALDLGEIAADRFRINEEVIRESRRKYIEIVPPRIEPGLRVLCPPFGLERVLDNLLNNATKAIPREGGRLAMRVFAEKGKACLEVRNSGEIPEDQLALVRRAEAGGRGLGIISRFVQVNHGDIDVRTEAGETVFRVRLPLIRTGASSAA